MAVIVSATVTVSTSVETDVLTCVMVMVVNGPVGTVLVITAAGPALHKAQIALVHSLLPMSFSNKKGLAANNWTKPQNGV